MAERNPNLMSPEAMQQIQNEIERDAALCTK